MRNKSINGFLILSSLVLFACGGGGGGTSGGNPPGQNSGGGNNPGTGGTAPVAHWYVSSGLGRDSPLGAISCPATNLCFASGGNEILKSADNGQSWTVSYQDLTIPSGITSVFLSGISFPDPLNGFANLPGNNPMIKTGNGGNTWSAARALFGTSFAFADSRHGTAAYLNLIPLQYSTDGGTTWPAAAITVRGTSTTLANYFFSKPVFIASSTGNYSTGYVAAFTSDPSHMYYTSILLISADSGATWVDIPTTFGSQRFISVNFVDYNHGWIGTFEGNVLITTDGGATWARHSIGIGVPITAITCVGNLNCWVLGGDTIQASTDGGATWTKQTPPDSTGYFTNFHDIHFTDTTHGIVVGYRYQTVGGPGSDFAAYTTTGGF